MRRICTETNPLNPSAPTHSTPSHGGEGSENQNHMLSVYHKKGSSSSTEQPRTCPKGELEGKRHLKSYQVDSNGVPLTVRSKGQT